MNSFIFCFSFSLHRFTIGNILLLLLLIVSSANGAQRIVEEPEDTVARVGDTVQLRCRVADQKGQVIWMQGDIGLGPQRDLPFWERMRMVGSPKDGEFHLEIRNVSIADEETYQCQLSSSEDEPIAKLSRRAKLTVLYEPTMPQLLGESVVGTVTAVPSSAAAQRTQPIAATEGRAIRLSCQSRAGKPPARLSWALAEDWQAQKVIGHIANWTIENGTTTAHAGVDQQRWTTPITGHPIRVREHLRQSVRSLHPIFGNISEELVQDGDTKLSTTTSHLTFVPSQAENGRWMVCLAAHELYGHESRSASIQLDVLYAPKVRIETIPEASQIYEGGYIRLHCATDARPNDVKLRWSWDGEPKRLEVVDAQNVLINGLRFNDNGRRVTCTAENTIDVGTGVFELDVPYGPRFMSTNQSKVVERGEQATFQCEVLGNPTPTVRWYHGRDMVDNIPIEEGKNLTITDVLDWKEGEYMCVAEVYGFPPKSLHHMLLLKGPPKVELSDQFDFDATSVILSCKVQHRSERVKVYWYHNGRRVDIIESGGVPHHHQPNKNADAIDESSGDDDHQQLRHYTVRDDRINRWLIVSRLTIHRFTDADFGTYNCTARNEHGLGSDQREIRLNAVDTLRWYVNKTTLEASVGIGVAALLLLLVACSTCCCCVRKWRRRRCGHTKFSNHRSTKSNGDVTVKVEELMESNGTNTSSTAPLCDEFFPTDYHFNGSSYSPNNNGSFVGSAHHQPQYSTDQQHYIVMGNGTMVPASSMVVDQPNNIHQQQAAFCPSYQSFNNGGIVNTFGRKTVFNNNNNGMLPSLMSSPNSFDGGMMAIDGPPPPTTTMATQNNAAALAFAGMNGNRSSPPYNNRLSQQQQQQYGIIMETVPEEVLLHTPDSTEADNGTFFTSAGIMMQLADEQQLQQQRTISRNSTHV
ncbi:hypothetical protein niasHT_034931 [Heterodera trifolii]|uniref:Ig-like domain-containing protein n=1 Tax=Heterodera trifolii TaxID=157864 RepID=A0ABD2I253_9BILA